MQRDTLYVWLTGLLVLIISMCTAAAGSFPVEAINSNDYAYYQGRFKRLVADKLGAEKAGAVPSGMQQVWIESLNRPDRCVSCHRHDRVTHQS